VQLGQPAEIYDNPADLFVADFVGKTNLLAGKVSESARDSARVTLANGVQVSARTKAMLFNGQSVSISVRPEAIRLGSAQALLTGTIRNRIFLGSTAEYAIEVPGIGMLLASADHNSTETGLMKPGEPVAIGFAADAPLALPQTQ